MIVTLVLFIISIVNLFKRWSLAMIKLRVLDLESIVPGSYFTFISLISWNLKCVGCVFFAGALSRTLSLTPTYYLSFSHNISHLRFTHSLAHLRSHSPKPESFSQYLTLVRLAKADPIGDAVWGSGWGKWKSQRYTWLFGLPKGERISKEKVEEECDKR